MFLFEYTCHYSVNANTTQAFMWETFTTKPYHDSGECSRLGDISTPWPCFMVAGLHEVVNAKLDAVRNALAAIHEASTFLCGVGVVHRQRVGGWY